MPESGSDSHGDDTSATLPTTPASVVWSDGHAYVLEVQGGRPRWIGLDERGRPRVLTEAALERRYWNSRPPR